MALRFAAFSTEIPPLSGETRRCFGIHGDFLGWLRIGNVSNFKPSPGGA
jgi:hypothetical protein